jgi:hypothetical protein
VHALTKISNFFPVKLYFSSVRTGIDQKALYQNQIASTFDQITMIKTFFYLTELPQHMTESFSIE